MTSKKIPVLVVDDDRSLCEVLANTLEYAGYNTDIANNGKTGLSKIKQDFYELVLLDLKLPDMSGMEVLKKILDFKPSLQVVMISGEGTIHTAVEATKLGAYDFLEKPLDSDRVLLTLKNAMDRGRLEREKAVLLESVKEHYLMIGKSSQMARIHELIRKAAETNSKVLIEGENGTGKELVARAIHHNSRRATFPFVAVNCAAIPDTLIESELFGHKKGAFTGAIADKPGRFQQADGGTIFLDEIGDMSIMTQSKVLRVLEEGMIEMVGGSEPVSIDTRVIAATNKILQNEMNEGKFREDLYFRLNVLNIKVPPLRDRREDIPALVGHFIQYFCNEHGIKMKRIGTNALNLLIGYSWPGNVRELKNFIEKLVILVDSTEIGTEHISSILQGYTQPKMELASNLNLKKAREQFERDFIREKLLTAHGNVTKAAEILDIPRTYLHKKINRLGIRWQE